MIYDFNKRYQDKIMDFFLRREVILWFLPPWARGQEVSNS